MAFNSDTFVFVIKLLPANILVIKYKELSVLDNFILVHPWYNLPNKLIFCHSLLTFM